MNLGRRKKVQMFVEVRTRCQAKTYFYAIESIHLFNDTILYESIHCFSDTIHYESINSYSETEMNRLKSFEKFMNAQIKQKKTIEHLKHP